MISQTTGINLNLISLDSSILFTTSSTTRASVDATGDWVFTQGISTSGSPTFSLWTSAAHTTLAASTEAITANFDFSATVQFATGALATQRSVLIQGQTIAFVAASTVTTATTLEVEPPALGANATFTNVFAARFTGNVEVMGKLTVGGLIDPTGITMSEQAADPGSTGAGFGTYWVVNTAPTRPRFTDDTGTDRNFVTTPATALLTAQQIVCADANGYLTDAGSTALMGFVGVTEMYRTTATGFRIEVGGVSADPDVALHVAADTGTMPTFTTANLVVSNNSAAGDIAALAIDEFSDKRIRHGYDNWR